MTNIYGPNGNRWFVAYNTSQQDRTLIGTSVGNPLTTTPSGYESLPSGDAADDAKFAAAAAATATNGPQPAGKGPTISVENITWSNVNGPYSTQAAANAAIPGIQKSEPAPGVVQQAENNIPGVSDITSAEGFFNALGDANLWIRIVKVIMGGAILAVGLVKLTGMDNNGGIAAKAVKIAPFL